MNPMHAFATHNFRLNWLALTAACLLVAAMPAPGFSQTEVDLSRPGADAGATRVRVAISLADLHEVTGADQTFHADVIVVAEWLDPRQARRSTTVRGVSLSDIWNPRLTLVNQKSVFP